MIEMMFHGVGKTFPCFVNGENAIEALRLRLQPRGKMSKSECRAHMRQIISESIDNWTTRWYDRYQFCCQNILY